MKQLLFLVDMQKDFVDGVLGSKEAQEIVPKIVKFLESYEGDIIVTKDMHDNYDEDTSIELSRLPLHCNGEGSHIIDELIDITKDKITLYKDNFSVKPIVLEEYVGNWIVCNKEEELEVVLIGLCTDICVLANATTIRSLFPKLKIKVLKDLCAGSTPTKHEQALSIMGSLCIDVE